MAPQLRPSLFFLPLLLSLSIFLPTVLGTITSCRSGEIFRSGRCMPCPPGSYQPFETFRSPPNRCVSCPLGTFNPNSGAISRGLCRPCYPGTAANTTGSTSCTPCPPGTVAKRGAKQCLACGPGTYYSNFDFLLRESNPSVCKQCPKNYFSTEVANLDCEQCPEGFTTRDDKKPVSSDACVLCPAGTESYMGSRGCNNCENGRFKPTAAPGRCLRCAPGFISKSGRNLQCKTCAVGFYARFSECHRCAEGLTTAKRGARFCRRLDYPCPPGMFENKRGDCDKCDEGYKYNKRKRVCEKCPAGLTSPGGLVEECSACPAGQIAEEGMFCRCPDGLVPKADGVCVKCPAGTFKNRGNTGYPSTTECQKCDRGFFSEEGSAFCKPCPRGSVADMEGSASCKTCPKGTMPNIPLFDIEEEAVGCVDVRTGCPFGWVRKEIGATSGPVFGCRKIVCRVGTKPEDIGQKCAPCDEGQRLDDSGKNCKRCGPKSFSLGGIVTNCTQCPDGKFRTYTSPPMCTCRRGGFGMRDGTCKACKRGTFSDIEAEVCRPCLPGTFAGSQRTYRCTECPFGTIAKKKGAKMCETCPPGTRPNHIIAATRCVPTGST